MFNNNSNSDNNNPTRLVYKIILKKITRKKNVKNLRNKSSNLHQRISCLHIKFVLKLLFMVP